MILLAILFIILNILDITSSRKVLRNGGYEANPIARLLMRYQIVYPGEDCDGHDNPLDDGHVG